MKILNFHFFCIDFLLSSEKNKISTQRRTMCTHLGWQCRMVLLRLTFQFFVFISVIAVCLSPPTSPDRSPASALCCPPPPQRVRHPRAPTDGALGQPQGRLQLLLPPPVPGDGDEGHAAQAASRRRRVGSAGLIFVVWILVEFLSRW